MYAGSSRSSRLFVEPGDPYHRQLMALNEQIATNVGPSDIEIAYDQTFADVSPVRGSAPSLWLVAAASDMPFQVNARPGTVTIVE